MHIAYHKVLKNKKKKNRYTLEVIMDNLVYTTALFGVIANIPQLSKIWIDKEVTGVSIITWLGFLVGSIFWLFYGIIHREKPIIVTNILYVAVQFMIVLGLLLAHVPFTFF